MAKQQPPRAGEKVAGSALRSAETVRRMLRAGDWVARQAAGENAKQSDYFHDSGVFKFLNNTGVVLNPGDIFVVKKPYITHAENPDEWLFNTTVEGMKPGDCQCAAIGIAHDIVGTCEVGRGILAGVSRCKVEIPDTELPIPSKHWKFATCIDGDTTKLKAVPSGPIRILHKPSGACSIGEQMCLVRFEWYHPCPVFEHSVHIGRRTIPAAGEDPEIPGHHGWLRMIPEPATAKDYWLFPASSGEYARMEHAVSANNGSFTGTAGIAEGSHSYIARFGKDSERMTAVEHWTKPGLDGTIPVIVGIDFVNQRAVHVDLIFDKGICISGGSYLFAPYPYYLYPFDYSYCCECDETEPYDYCPV